MSDYLSHMNESNIAYIESLYEDYQTDPMSVDESWRYFFEGYEFTKKNKILGLTKDQKDNAKVEALINKYRQVGHLYAHINPLADPGERLFDKEKHKLESIESSDVFNPSDFTDQAMHLEDIVAKLEQTYCHHIGADISELSDSEQALWFQNQMEACSNTPQLSEQEKKRVHKKLCEAEGFERFLQARYLGQKRFSLEGLESLIPLLDSLLSECSDIGTQEVCLGMAHRGRLNVLTNIMEKPSLEMLQEFEGSEFNPYDIDGDVKYHKGYANTITCFSGKKVRVYLSPNPSHLEAVNPVLEGFTKSRQENQGGIKSVIPILIHGDASFVGQGIVAETLNLSRLEGYTTGGTIHIITNNMIGFTTNPEDSRSCHYSSDIAKVIRAPVIHVNSSDPEAVIWAAHLACSFRDTFHHDIVIDLVGYRKYGHNETDEPGFTQPLLYAQIKKHPSTLETYSQQLVSENVMSEAEVEQAKSEVRQSFQGTYDTLKKNTKKKPLKAQKKFPKELEHIFDYKVYTRKQIFSPIKTQITKKKISSLSEILTTTPDDFTPHPKIVKLLENRKKMTEGTGAIDWAFAELLALGSLAHEGFSIRLSGQDTKRGTFSSRHAVLFDYKTSEPYEPLTQFENNYSYIVNSPLSEQGCLGFEFGYSVACERSLVIWEAQFGDFVNGAQIILDQFLVASEAKWKQVSDLVLLLPHGHEGMGPEHSSARPERFLQCCGNLNIQVCSPSTPAQYFHLLRRQKLTPHKKPLVIMSPKSLLRHPKVISKTGSLAEGTFEPILVEEPKTKKKESFVIFCCGKVYYDLLQHKEDNKPKKNPMIVRVEQLYPFPKELVRQFLKKNPQIKEIRWIQEEPKNMGAWNFIQYRLKSLISNIDLNYVGRKHSGSTAEGTSKAHTLEQKRIVTEAFA